MGTPVRKLEALKVRTRERRGLTEISLWCDVCARDLYQWDTVGMDDLVITAAGHIEARHGQEVKS